MELELSKGARERLKELRALSEEAKKGGDKKARRELRKAVRASAPEVVAEVSNIDRTGQWLIMRRIASDPLEEEAFAARRDALRGDLLGERPTVLEAMLVERIVSAWVVGEFFEAIMAGQLGVSTKGSSSSYLRFLLGWQEQAHRRLLSAIKTLATVRRLQSGTPGSQTNVQINLAASAGGRDAS